MNITDGGMMGFNFSRKKNNNVVRIRQSSWLSYIEALEACLESDEEKIILYDMALDCLPEGRNKEIVILVSLGFTYDEIRKRYDNISRERIRQIYYRQVQIIQNRMCKDDKD